MEEEALTAKYIAAIGDDQAREEGEAVIEDLLSKRKAAMKEGSEMREAEAREEMLEKTGVAEVVRGGHGEAEAVAAVTAAPVAEAWGHGVTETERECAEDPVTLVVETRVEGGGALTRKALAEELKRRAAAKVISSINGEGGAGR